MAERTYFDLAQDVQLESLRRRGTGEGVRSVDIPRANRDPAQRRLLIGVCLVVLGALLVIALVARGSSTHVVTAADAPTESVAQSGHAQGIPTGHVISSMALEMGTYPPDLAIGDTVMIVVTPTTDSNATVHALAGTAIVEGVSRPVEGSTKVVVSVDVPSSLAVDLAGADAIHLFLVGRAS